MRVLFKPGFVSAVPLTKYITGRDTLDFALARLQTQSVVPKKKNKKQLKQTPEGMHECKRVVFGLQRRRFVLASPF